MWQRICNWILRNKIKTAISVLLLVVLLFFLAKGFVSGTLCYCY